MRPGEFEVKKRTLGYDKGQTTIHKQKQQAGAIIGSAGLYAVASGRALNREQNMRTEERYYQERKALVRKGKSSHINLRSREDSPSWTWGKKSVVSVRDWS